ncbi:glycosyltransferase family 4 protein [Thiothrix subterranea]|uniref:Glycosyltransferase family 4 protein n=1 Tax=Thiothrix subterranea TaxID=2735563 RepID=A0AA51MQL7_9GAMM|nr:glycosyltransferase family 4 protein [Thiothrix subterranea]WML88570.1 glycosyltransferase family 4 protein [Thiothrix subterranea]
MKILFLHHYAGSPKHGMSYRVYYLAREWVKAGHDVRIYAASYSHIRAVQPELPGSTLSEVIDGINYTWFKTPTYTGNGIGRVKNMAAFVLRLFHEGKTIANAFKPDIVIASSTYPMDIWPAHRIAKFANAKLIFEVHDLWPLSPMELGGMSKWHPFIMLVQQAEDYAYRHADLVVSMLPKVRDYMESRGMASHKLHIIPNGIDPAEWQNDHLSELEPSVKTQLSQFKNQNTPIVGYAGTHGVANALETLLDTAQYLKDEKIVFVLVGGGSDKKALQRRVQHERIKNVIFFDPIKKNQIPALLQYFDIAYIGWHHQPLYRFGIAPNKLMDYMMAKRVILHSVDAGNDPVTEAGCGLTVPPENPQAIAQGIRQLLALSPSERTVMGQRGRDYVLQNHTYPVLAKKFLLATNLAQ